MPKAAPYRLTWVPVRGIYVLRDDQQNEQTLPVTPGSQEWFAWLTSIPSFTFSGQHGQLTVRQEARRGGGVYWYAYRRRGGKMLKRYLGRTADLTPSHLEEVALQLAAPPASHPKSDTGGVDADAESGPAAAPGQGVQDDPLHHLLMSKLQMPRLRARLVTRSHLTQRLQQGMEQALTLVSAPAGFGKTTLLAQWIAERGLPVACLSLSPEDNDPVRFLSYMIAALRMVDAHLGATSLALLLTPQPPPPETVMAFLSNDLMRSTSGDFALVLDDYHVITAEPIHRALTSLVEHMPPQMHLIIATRADPPLPLARLRVRGLLTELRAAELRFRAAEAGTFLEEVMGLHLSPSDVAALQTRTEGWIAGLQLAALSLQGRANVSGFLPAFSGSHRFVLDYLSEEVLSRQPPGVQTFLLQTSILERLSGSLCDAVTGLEESQVMLEALDRANLFVAALDDERQWYRYHQLFADLLRSRLQQTVPVLLPELHRRASTWYEQHDLIIEAMHHALLAPDVDSTIRLIEQHTHSLALRGQVHTVLNWMHALPGGLVRAHPRLCFPMHCC